MWSWGQKLVFHGAVWSVCLVEAWWEWITYKSVSRSLPDLEITSSLGLGFPASGTSKFHLLWTTQVPQGRSMKFKYIRASLDRHPSFKSAEGMFELQQKTWVSWPKKSSHKMNCSAPEKMNHLSRLRVLSVAGHCLWWSQQMTFPIWSGNFAQVMVPQGGGPFR